MLSSEAWSARFHRIFSRFDGAGETARFRIVEVLARGTHSVLPPSMHPPRVSRTYHSIQKH